MIEDARNSRVGSENVLFSGGEHWSLLETKTEKLQ